MERSHDWNTHESRHFFVQREVIAFDRRGKGQKEADEFSSSLFNLGAVPEYVDTSISNKEDFLLHVFEFVVSRQYT